MTIHTTPNSNQNTQRAYYSSIATPTGQNNPTPSSPQDSNTLNQATTANIHHSSQEISDQHTTAPDTRKRKDPPNDPNIINHQFSRGKTAAHLSILLQSDRRAQSRLSPSSETGQTYDNVARMPSPLLDSDPHQFSRGSFDFDMSELFDTADFMPSDLAAIYEEDDRKPAAITSGPNLVAPAKQANDSSLPKFNLSPLFSHPSIFFEKAPSGIASHSIEHLQHLIKNGDINYRLTDNNNKDLFILSIESGSIEAVETLLENSNNFSPKDKTIRIRRNDSICPNQNDVSVLNACIEQNNLDMLRYLLSIGFKNDINKADKNGQTPLIKAASLGHTEIVKELAKEKHIDLLKLDNNNLNALMYAAMGGHLDILTTLTKNRKGSFLQAQSPVGNTPLSLARERNHTAIVSYIETKTRSLRPPTAAFFFTRPEMPCTRPVNWTSPDDGESCLMRAASHGSLHHKIEPLLSSGADIELKDHNGDTALHYSAHCRDSTATRLLLAAGAQINHPNNHGETPLISAIKRFNVEGIHALAKGNARFNYRDKHNRTPLSHASDPAIRQLQMGDQVFQTFSLYQERSKIIEAKSKNS